VTGLWKFSISIIFIFVLSGCGGGADSDPAPASALTGIYTTTTKIEVQPGEKFQIKVIATYEDGSEKDVSDSNAVFMFSTLYDANNNSQNGLISFNQAGNEVTALVIGTGFSTVYYSEFDAVTDEPYAFQMDVEVVIGNQVPAELQGQWQYVHSGTEKWLGKVVEYEYTQIDANQLKLTGSDNNTYYLIRAGIPNVQVAGQLSAVTDLIGKSKPENKAISVGDISLILENISTNEQTEVTPNLDGTFDVALPSTDYELVATDTVSGEIVTTEVEIGGAAVDIGEFTLTSSSSYNFKTSLRKDTFNENNEYLYFGTLPGQEEIVYYKTIRISNIGNQDASGVSFNVSMTDPDVRNLTAENTLGGMAAGGYLEIPVSFSFNRPLTNKAVTIDITMTDINNKVWTDYISLPLSKEIPVTVSAKSKTLLGVNGYVVTPGRKLLKLSGTSSIVRLPYIPGDTYDVTLAASSITTEEAYCLGIGYTGACNSSVFDSFTQTGIYEPDNEVSTATPASLLNELVSYVSVGDIDYFKFSFDALTKPFDAYTVNSIDTPGLAYSVSLVGNYAYIVDANIGLQIIDISDHSQISIDNTYVVSSSENGLFVSGNYAYVFDTFYGLTVLDVSNPVAPLFVGRQIVSGKALGGTVVNNLVYLASEQNGLHIIDVTTPATPSLLGVVDTPGLAQTVAVKGSIAYVADSLSGVQVIDVSDSANPVILSNVSTTGAAWAVKVVGDIAYIADNGVGLLLYDISTPSTPVPLGIVENLYYFNDIKVEGTIAYVTDYYSGLQFIDISTPSNPVIIGKIIAPGTPAGVEIRNGFAYVANTSQGFSVISLTSPAVP